MKWRFIRSNGAVVDGYIVLESGSFLPMDSVLVVFRLGCGGVRMRCTVRANSGRSPKIRHC